MRSHAYRLREELHFHPSDQHPTLKDVDTRIVSERYLLAARCSGVLASGGGWRRLRTDRDAVCLFTTVRRGRRAALERSSRARGGARRQLARRHRNAVTHQNIQISREKITGRLQNSTERTSSRPRTGLHRARLGAEHSRACRRSSATCRLVPRVGHGWLTPGLLQEAQAPPDLRLRSPRPRLTGAVVGALRNVPGYDRSAVDDRLDLVSHALLSAVMDTVYPATASALARGRRLRRAEPRHRHRTTPVTFAEIKEVDEENSEAEACEARCAASAAGAPGARRRPDVLEERLGRQFAEFRRRRERRDVLREREPESPPPAPPTPAARAAAPPLARAGSEPSALHHRAPADT